MHDPQQLAHFVKFSRASKGERVLDVACGAGTLALEFARHGCRITGVDFSRKMLDRAAEIAAEALLPVVLVRADSESLPFQDASFDLVYSRASFHHFEHPERALDEMIRVAKPGGRILIADFIASEVKCKRHYQNRIEKLRASGHFWTHPFSTFEQWVAERRLRVVDRSVRILTYSFDEWIDPARPHPNREKIRAMLEHSIAKDKSGMNVRFVDGVLTLDRTMLFLFAAKPG